MHVWKQDLTDETGEPGGIWRYGRGRVAFASWEGPSIGATWSFLRRNTFTTAGVEMNGPNDDDWTLSFGIAPLFTIWLQLNGIRPLRAIREFLEPHEHPYDREVSINLAGGVRQPSAHWQVWHSGMAWRAGTPRWRCGSFDLYDWLLGRPEHSEQILSVVHDVPIPMPEGSYMATVTFTREEWKRPRSPARKVVYRAKVEMVTPIPVPGKGENSWDCGDNAHYGATCPARTLDEAVAAVVKSALRDRVRYGNRLTFRTEVQSA